VLALVDGNLGRAQVDIIGVQADAPTLAPVLARRPDLRRVNTVGGTAATGALVDGLKAVLHDLAEVLLGFVVERHDLFDVDGGALAFERHANRLPHN